MSMSATGMISVGVLWLPVLYAAAKITAGILIVVLGRRYVRRQEETP